MKLLLSSLVCLIGLAAPGLASPELCEDVLGTSLGGWKAKGGKAADYEISGVNYRTWRPHVTSTLDGGIFLSVRIDHLRGILASDDHASLELCFARDGGIVSAQSTIALQGRKITSDVIQGSTKFGTSAVGAERVVKVGTDLVASLTAKMLREKVTEPGRVGFPAAVRHNYNLLCLAVRRSVPDVAVDPIDDLVDPTPGVSDAVQSATAGTGKRAKGEGKDPGPERAAPAPELEIREQGKAKAASKTEKLPVPAKG